MSTTTLEEDPYMVVIQKVIPHIGDRLRTMECAIETGQNAQLKATKKLAYEVKQLRAIVGDFTNECFQLIFMPGKNRLLPQSFDHILHRYEQSSSPTLQAAHHTFPYSISPLASLLFLSSRLLDDPTPCAPSVLKVFEKNKKMPKYTLSWKISTIPEIWRE